MSYGVKNTVFSNSMHYFVSVSLIEHESFLLSENVLKLSDLICVKLDLKLCLKVEKPLQVTAPCIITLKCM